MQNLTSNKGATKSTPLVLGELSANVVFKMWSWKKCGSYRSASLHFKKFCTEIISKSPISETTVFLSLKYVQKYIKKGNNLNFNNEYQLFTIALMLANKWHNDKIYATKFWAELSHISQADIDTLEISFLKSLNFKMHITGEKYSFWLNCLKNYHLTGKLEHLFAIKIKKTAAFVPSLPEPGFFHEQTIDSKRGGLSRKVENNDREKGKKKEIIYDTMYDYIKKNIRIGKWKRSQKKKKKKSSDISSWDNSSRDEREKAALFFLWNNYDRKMERIINIFGQNDASWTRLSFHSIAFFIN
ncbi:hypothetical protein Glove_17g51 [Diversispora epigaea]|uniref:Cyclin N-terminal domain-containing protein n=1 Tax=Diversispora epigaea TaxID=1348612 RepID=A0A397JPG3_9GLOM|nr:hypothetical protein Glove_17g51 [Diversispora epigaea]